MSVQTAQPRLGKPHDGRSRNDAEDRDEEESEKTSACDGTAYRLRLTPDNLAVLLDCPDPGSDIGSLVDLIREELEGIGLPDIPSRDVLEQRLQASRQEGRDLTDVVLLAGMPVLPAQDSRLVWARDFFTQGFAVDDRTKAVNYWERLQDLSVGAGEPLARLHPPRPGKPGRDLFGRPIPVDQPIRVAVRKGPHVRSEEAADGEVFYAEVDGRLRWAQSVLAVDPVYTVRGHVGLETGYVRHPGAIMILGDVLTGARIRADGEIIVQGVIESSHLQSGGDLTVRGGIVGSEGYAARVGGRLRAKYLLDADITADGDVLIANEIMHSRVRTRGRVVIKHGRIVGSEVVALGGIQVGEVGGEGAAPTLLVSGVDYALPKLLAPHQEKLEVLRGALDKIQATLDLALERGVLTTEQKIAVARLQTKSEQLREEMQAVRARIDEVTRNSRNRAQCTIDVFEKVMPDTSLQIGKVRRLFNREISQPRRFGLRGGEIMVWPLSGQRCR